MEKMALIMESVNSEFWRGKRVFLTGHTGFKGSWLSLWLQSMGAELFGLALDPPTRPSLYEAVRIGEGMSSKICDVRDYDAVHGAMQTFKPDIVIHMAAQPLVRYSYHAPVETYATNVMGTVNLLEAARQVGTMGAIINVTTDKCYENKEWVWGYREDEPMGGHDPYSNSKGCSELVTRAYRRSFLQEMGISLASARAGNVIGGGDWAEDRLVPDILRAFGQNEAVVVRNPLATRPWQHVLEPLSGYLILAERSFNERQEFAQGWNFGPHDDDVCNVQWIVDHMVQAWGNGASWKLEEADQPHEANYLKLDISKARTKLGWSPRWDLSTTLDQIIDWHQSWVEEGDIQAKCLQQINQYNSSI